MPAAPHTSGFGRSCHVGSLNRDFLILLAKWLGVGSRNSATDHVIRCQVGDVSYDAFSILRGGVDEKCKHLGLNNWLADLDSGLHRPRILYRSNYTEWGTQIIIDMSV